MHTCTITRINSRLAFVQECRAVQETEFYAELANYRKWKHLLEKTKYEISQLTDGVDEAQEKVWQLISKTVKQNGKCNDGRRVEGKHIFNEAVMSSDELKKIDSKFLVLQEKIASEYCQQTFMTHYTERHIEIMLNAVLELEHSDSRKAQLKRFISSLFAFVRLDDVNADFLQTCTSWLSKLISVLLECADFEDHLFIVNHVLRCPGGIADWAAGYIQCNNPVDANDFAQAVVYLNQSLAILNTILTHVK